MLKMKNKKSAKTGRKSRIIGIILIVIASLIGLVVIVPALTSDEKTSLQSELDNLTSELDSGGYSWLANYSINYPSIEVYTKNSVEVIAKFENIIKENWYTVYLTNLSENESYDVFDLKIIEAEENQTGIEFDYIVDPTITEDLLVTTSILTNITAETGASNFTHLSIDNLTTPYDSLIGYWNFDEKLGEEYSNITIYDYSVGDRNGVLFGRSSVISTGCIYGNCLNLDGEAVVEDASVNLVNNWTFTTNDSMTLMAWFYPVGQYVNDGRLITSANECVLRRNGNNIEFILNTFTAEDRIAWGGTVTANTWMHATGVYDNATDNLTLYFNGLPVNSTVPTGTYGACATWRIGSDTGGSSGNFNGSIDEVMVFNGALTDAQVLNIYNNQSVRFAKEGTQDITSINVSGDGTENRVNITLGDCKTNLESSLTGQMGIEYDYNGSVISLSSCGVNNLTINGDPNNVSLRLTFLAGNITDYFYSPLVIGNITLDSWYEAEAGAEDTAPPNINFTYPTPDDNSIEGGNSTFVNVTADDTSKISTFINLDNSLLAWWRMDDLNASDDIADYFGNNNGTKVGNIVINSTNGYLGNGSELDGNGDYIDFGSNSNLDFYRTIDYTWAGWFKTKDITNDQVILDHQCSKEGESNGGGIAILINSSKLRAFEGGSETLFLSSDSDIIVNTWVHFAVTCDYENGQDYCDLYLNGTHEGTQQSTYAQADVSGYNVYVGTTSTDCYSDSYYFNGTIDDVMIFNRTLSATEIQALYADQTSKYLEQNFTDLAEGSHTFTAYAQDTSGNVNSTETKNITLDTQEVTICRTLNQANTVYTQRASITQTANADCIVISDENITFDGNGYSIISDYNVSGVFTNQSGVSIQNTNITMGNGTGGYGIEIDGITTGETNITNNTLNGQNIGIAFSGSASNGTAIEENTLTNNYYGVYLFGQNITVKNNNISSNEKGIYNDYDTTTFGHLFINNTIAGNNYGFYMYLADSNEFINNTIENSATATIYLPSSSNSLNNNFTNNQIIDSGTYGIYLADAFNNEIRDNNFSAEKYSIEITGSGGDSSKNIIENNSFIYMGGYYFISLSANSNNTVIANNTFGGGSGGIKIQSTDNEIDANTFQNISPAYTRGAIELALSSDNNITNNIISGINTAPGIYFTDSNTNFISNNTLEKAITGAGEGGTVYLNGSDNNIFINNTFQESQSSQIQLHLSDNNTFEANTFNLCASGVVYGACILINSSQENVFNENIISSNAYGILIISDINNASNNVFKNTNITSSIAEDVLLNNLSDSNAFNNTFINMSYNTESVSANAELIRKWHYLAYVNDTAGRNVITNITAFNISADYELNFTTDITGYSQLFEIIDYINNSGTTDYYSPYNITVVNSSYPEYVREYNFSTSAGVESESNYEDTISLFYSETNITLSQGWNLIAFDMKETDYGRWYSGRIQIFIPSNRNITIINGTNYIGFSANDSYNLENVTFDNSTGDTENWSTATSQSKVQAYLAYYEGGVFKYVSTPELPMSTKTLQQSKAYRVITNEPGSFNMSGVGGTVEAESFNWADLMLTYGGDEKNISDADDAGWVFMDDGGVGENIVYLNNEVWKKVCGGPTCTTTLDPWTGYWLWSNYNDVIISRRY